MSHPTARTAGAPLASIGAASHVAIEVSDLARSVRFYEEVLGLRIFMDDRSATSAPSVKGLVGGFGVELQQAPRPGEPRTDPATVCLSFTVRDAAAAFERLKAAGHVEAEQPTTDRGATFFFFKDPDGNVFELIEFPGGLTSLADLADLFAPQASAQV